MGVQSPGLGKFPTPLAVTFEVQIQLELNIEALMICLSTEEKMMQKQAETESPMI